MRKFSLIAFIALAFINKSAWGMDDTGMCGFLSDSLPTSAVSRAPVEPSPFRLLDDQALKNISAFLERLEIVAFMNSKKRVNDGLRETVATAYIQELSPLLAANLRALSPTQKTIIARELKFLSIEKMVAFKGKFIEALESVSADRVFCILGNELPPSKTVPADELDSLLDSLFGYALPPSKTVSADELYSLLGNALPPSRALKECSCCVNEEKKLEHFNFLLCKLPDAVHKDVRLFKLRHSLGISSGLGGGSDIGRDLRGWGGGGGVWRGGHQPSLTYQTSSWK